MNTEPQNDLYTPLAFICALQSQQNFTPKTQESYTINIANQLNIKKKLKILVENSC